MVKLLLILLFGLLCESAGIILLKKGMMSIGSMASVNAPEIFRVLKAGATNPQILLGIFFEAVFFACLLVLMARSDISFLWPLTGLSFVFATFAAIYFLQEHVSGVRWAGVFLIMAGAALISYSEQLKSKELAPVTTSAPGPSSMGR